MVSSTVPRFDERWPPVEETESTMKARSSAASCASCLRSRVRSSAGSSTVSRRGYELMRGFSILTPPVDDEIGDLRQAPPAGAKVGQRTLGIGEELEREAACLGEAHEAGVGRL